MKPRHLVAAALCALALTACSTEDPKPVSPPVMPATETTSAAASGAVAPGVNAPMDVGVSKSTGVEASILSVEDVVSKYGPVTVFTFQLHNAGDKLFEGFNFPTPTVVYGPAGTPADHRVSLSEGFGEGAVGSIPPGMRQTVKYAYDVTKDQLNPAVVSAGSVIWQGDFTTFQR